jgi:hypothetical protein
VNDFVALLLAVAAFLITMLAGQALIWASRAAWSGFEPLFALGPALQLAASLPVAFIAYRRLLRPRRA